MTFIMGSLVYVLCALIFSSLFAHIQCNPVTEAELLPRVSTAFENINAARNNGGFVTAEDLKAILTGLDIDTTDTSKLIKIMDTSNDGSVTYDEYIQLVDLLTIFNMVDRDLSGIISEKELTNAIPEDVLNQVNLKEELQDNILNLYEFAVFRMKLKGKDMSLSVGAIDAIIESVQEGTSISVDNIVDLLSLFKVNITETQELFKALDVFADGKLDINELAKPWDYLLQFKIVDSDKSDSVSAKELQGLFDSQINIKPRNAVTEMKKINKDRRDELSFVEFLTLMS